MNVTARALILLSTAALLLAPAALAQETTSEPLGGLEPIEEPDPGDPATSEPDPTEVQETVDDTLQQGDEGAAEPAPSGPVRVVEEVSSPDFGLGIVSGLGLAAVGWWLAFRGGAKIVTRDNVLDHDTRAELYQMLRDEPGIHLRAIAKEMGLSTTNTLWHLRKLESADLIAHKMVNSYKVYYPKEGGLETTRRAIANNVLSKENPQLIMTYLLHHPGGHQREMARALEVNHGTVRWHIKKMVDAGLVTEVKHDLVSQYYVTPYGLQTLEGLDMADQEPAEGPDASASAA